MGKIRQEYLENLAGDCVCMFRGATGTKESWAVYILLLFTQTYYVLVVKGRLFTLQSEGLFDGWSIAFLKPAS